MVSDLTEGQGFGSFSCLCAFLFTNTIQRTSVTFVNGKSKKNPNTFHKDFQ